MSRIIELPAGDDATIFVEVDDSRAHGTQRIAADAALEKISGTFEGALANIQKVAKGLYETLKKLEHAPDEAKFEFGVKLTGGARIIIASGTAEANLKVTLGWKAPANPQTAFIPWTALKDQFGPDYGRMDHFKAPFRKALKQVQRRYQSANIEMDNRGMTARNSPPPVTKRIFLVAKTWG